MDVVNGLEARRRILLNTPHIETANGSIATFQTDMVGKLKECKIYFEPIQEGSGDPSPDNVRPITGWTGCEVTRCGKNFLKLPRSVDAGDVGLNFGGWNKSKLSNNAYSAYNNYTYVSFEFINNSGVSVTKADWTNIQGLDLPCSIKGGELNYRLSYSASGKHPRLGRAWFNKDGERIGYDTNTLDGKVKFPESASWCVHRFAPWSANSTTIFNNIQLELGDTATDFEPYQGTTIPIDWTDEAGTVYGGYVDLVRGEVVAEWGHIANYNGENLPSNWISDRDIYAAGATPTIGAQVAYKLATPIHYPIEPITLKTLRGTNNVFSNLNGNVEVKFYTH